MIKFNKAFHIEISIFSNSLGKLQHCQTCYFFGRGPQKKYIAYAIYIASVIYRICNISHLRYSKAKNKIKQRPQAPQISFSKHWDSEKLQERNSTSAIFVLPFRGRVQVRGGLLQWQVNTRNSFHLVFHSLIVFIISFFL